MYQGTNKTACASQRQIADATLTLMEERPFSELTVSEISKRSGVSRATFYSLFQSKENVVVYLLMQDCCDAPQEPGEDMLHSLCRSFGAYVSRQMKLLRLLSAQNLMPLLQGILRELFSGCVCFQSHVREELRPYAAGYVAAGLVGIATSCIREGVDEAILADIAYELLSGQFLMDLHPSRGKEAIS